MILGKDFNKAMEFVEKNAHLLKDYKDSEDNTILMISAYIGKFCVLQTLIKSIEFDINATNNSGLTALDIALLNGYYISAQILIDAGGIFKLNPLHLLMTCLNRGYKITADLMLKNKLVLISEEVAISAPNQVDELWLRARLGGGIPLDIAIIRGAFEVVEERLESITETLSWKNFLQIFNNPTENHCKIVNLLLEKKAKS